MDPELKANVMRLGMQAALMKELLHTPMWECYAEYLDLMIEDSVARTLQGTKEQFDYHKGVVMGLRDALTLPQSVIARAEAAARN